MPEHWKKKFFDCVQTPKRDKRGVFFRLYHSRQARGENLKVSDYWHANFSSLVLLLLFWLTTFPFPFFRMIKCRFSCIVVRLLLPLSYLYGIPDPEILDQNTTASEKINGDDYHFPEYLSVKEWKQSMKSTMLSLFYIDQSDGQHHQQWRQGGVAARKTSRWSTSAKSRTTH